MTDEAARGKAIADEAREGISAIEQQITERVGAGIELQWFHGKPLHLIMQSTPSITLRATRQGKTPIFVEFTLEQLADYSSDDQTREKVRLLLTQLGAG